jgi:hypothetical protein
MNLKKHGGLQSSFSICSKMGRWSNSPPKSTQYLILSTSPLIASKTNNISHLLVIISSPTLLFLQVEANLIGSTSTNLSSSFSQKKTTKGSSLAALPKTTSLLRVKLRSHPNIRLSNYIKACSKSSSQNGNLSS